MDERPQRCTGSPPLLGWHFRSTKEHAPDHPGGNPGAIRKSICHRCYLFEVAFVWVLTKETIGLPLGCLQGGLPCCGGAEASGRIYRERALHLVQPERACDGREQPLVVVGIRLVEQGLFILFAARCRSFRDLGESSAEAVTLQNTCPRGLRHELVL